MVGKILGQSVLKVFGKRPFAAQSAAKPKPQPEHLSASLPKQDVKTTTLPSGLVISSVENYSPVARIAVVVKAGSRYETSSNLGSAHSVRSFAGLSTKNHTIFGLTRNIEFVGGNLGVTCDRENVIFQLECNRDHMNAHIQYLGEVISQPAFKRWELEDFVHRMALDVAQYNAQPENVLMDALHKAAFRGGLCHSLCSPSFMIGKHTPDMLHEYVTQTFTTGRTAIVGLGVEHQALLDLVSKHFPLKAGQGDAAGSSKYTGGELLLDMNYPVTYVSVVAEGASLKNQKELLSLALLEQILGVGPRIKYSEAPASKLGSAASKATNKPFVVSGLNVNYSDTGLFGFCLVAQPEDITNIVKAVVGQMKESCKSPSAEDLKKAKHKLKAALLLNTECSNDLIMELGMQGLSRGTLTNAAVVEKAVDAITAQDVAAVAGKVMKSKGTLAAVGQLQNCPYLEDLV